MREIRTLRSTWRGLETWRGRNSSASTGAPVLDPTCERPAVRFRRATHLIPDKGQFRWRFPHPLSYCCPTTIFRDILAALFGRLRAVKGRSPHDGCGFITSIRKPAVQAIATCGRLEVYFRGHAASQGIVLPAEIWVVRARV